MLDTIQQWRTEKRSELIAARMAVPVQERTRLAEEIATELDRRIPADRKVVVSLYWPFRGELDFRPWMHTLSERGYGVALPVVVAKGRALQFREWTPGAPMERGVWNIPIPANQTDVRPDVVISPLVGFDSACYRLGYGGGFFDRTLAAASPRPFVIGVGHPSGALPSIDPQPHDIPMDLIIVGRDRIFGTDR